MDLGFENGMEEPRTLSYDQLQYAREAALYVLNTNSIEEAVRIFTEGLQPVPSMKYGKTDVEEVGRLEWLAVDDAVIARMRDIVTAPF